MAGCRRVCALFRSRGRGLRYPVRWLVVEGSVRAPGRGGAGGDPGRVLRGGVGTAAGFPESNRAELIRYFTLTPTDEAFVRRFRGRRNVLGAAVQLCTLPWLGFVPDEVAGAPAPEVARLSERLGIPVGELRGYRAREQTRTDHLREISGTWAGGRWAAWSGRSWRSSCSPGRWSTTRRSCCSGRRASTWLRRGWSGRVWCVCWSTWRPRGRGPGRRRGRRWRTWPMSGGGPSWTGCSYLTRPWVARGWRGWGSGRPRRHRRR